MTPIPVDLGWLIVAGFILMPAMAYLATLEANRHATRHHRKWMKAQEKALNDRTVKLLKREDAVYERESELGRKAHDLAAETHVVLRQANSPNTVPTMQEL